MDILNLSYNLVRLRREKKITQEELADFIGVTKASVSKWENRQSTPDILLLPQLAAFFDVTVDELLGYEPQLSPEQIRKRYMELTADFANLTMAEALEKTRKLVHRYYSCYPFLLQVCVLYLNHYMLARQEEEGKQILLEADRLCDRIIKNCSEVGICKDAISVKAAVMLQLGKPSEAVEILEPLNDPASISGENDTMLVLAYQMAGESEKAKSYNQIRTYLLIISLIGNNTMSLALHEADIKRCEETIRRTEGIIELYDIPALHPNISAQFWFQAAVFYASSSQYDMVLKKLRQFADCVCELLNQEKVMLHGDTYFDRLDEWISRLPLGGQAPRDIGFAKQSALEALAHPAFAVLQDKEEFQRICRRISEGGLHHD